MHAATDACNAGDCCRNKVLISNRAPNLDSIYAMLQLPEVSYCPHISRITVYCL